MTPNDLLMMKGTFTRLQRRKFFIETLIGNFVWTGIQENIILYTSKSLVEYIREDSVIGHREGQHVIGAYTGMDVIFTNATRATLSRF